MKTRDYQAEYRRRIERALAKGLTRSQGRGHARAGESPIDARPKPHDLRLEAALKELRATGNQAQAARAAGISAERFRNFLRSHKLAERRGRFWHLTDDRPRQIVVLSKGRQKRVTVPGFVPSSLGTRHWRAAKRFTETGDISLLAPFEGQSVPDITGREHPLETDPNTLYEIAAAGSEGFEEI